MNDVFQQTIVKNTAAELDDACNEMRARQDIVCVATQINIFVYNNILHYIATVFFKNL